MQRVKSPSPINKQTDLIRLSKMNGRLGDEDRKNVIISEEGKMKKDVIQKYTPRNASRWNEDETLAKKSAKHDWGRMEGRKLGANKLEIKFQTRSSQV